MNEQQEKEAQEYRHYMEWKAKLDLPCAHEARGDTYRTCPECAPSEEVIRKYAARRVAGPLMTPLPLHCDKAKGDHGGCTWSIDQTCACACSGCAAYWGENPRAAEATSLIGPRCRCGMGVGPCPEHVSGEDPVPMGRGVMGSDLVSADARSVSAGECRCDCTTCDHGEHHGPTDSCGIERRPDPLRRRSADARCWKCKQPFSVDAPRHCPDGDWCQFEQRSETATYSATTVTRAPDRAVPGFVYEETCAQLRAMTAERDALRDQLQRRPTAKDRCLQPDANDTACTCCQHRWFREDRQRRESPKPQQQLRMCGHPEYMPGCAYCRWRANEPPLEAPADVAAAENEECARIVEALLGQNNTLSVKIRNRMAARSLQKLAEEKKE